MEAKICRYHLPVPNGVDAGWSGWSGLPLMGLGFRVTAALLVDLVAR